MDHELQDEVREELRSVPMREEWAVIDESCNCRRSSRSREVVEGILASGQFLPNRPTKGPLHLERRWVSEWERV